MNPAKFYYEISVFMGSHRKKIRQHKGRVSRENSLKNARKKFPTFMWKLLCSSFLDPAEIIVVAVCCSVEFYGPEKLVAEKAFSTVIVPIQRRADSALTSLIQRR